jgi:branched-subunit amino acid transport protein
MPGIVAPTALVAPAVLVPLTALATTIDSDNVIALVWTVKSMRELGCEPFLGEQDA